MKRFFHILLAVLLFVDIAFTFIQHEQRPLDGDMSSIILPSKGYSTVLHDPFALNVLLHDSVYPATNRFVIHWCMFHYFRSVPLWIQHFSNPINSIYLSCALVKTIIEILLIYLLAVYITNQTSLLNFDLLLAAVLLAPLFQTFGYSGVMGIIDSSITYTFFYAFALAFVLLFFLPFFRRYFHENEMQFSSVSMILLFVLAILLSFNGALNPALILIICPFFICYQCWLRCKNYPALTWKNKVLKSWSDISLHVKLIFIFVSIISLYSFYAGTHNSENLWYSMPVLERYKRLPLGLFNLLTVKLGPVLLLAMIVVNALLIRRYRQDAAAKKLLRLLKWMGGFALVYILLLPLGGFRGYRPDIIRRDTFMPVLFAMLIFYGLSTFFLFKKLEGKSRKIYIGGIVIFLLIFKAADLSVPHQNACERAALQQIAQSSQSVVQLNNACTVMSWKQITDYHYSDINAALLQYWHVTKKKKLYYSR